MLQLSNLSVEGEAALLLVLLAASAAKTCQLGMEQERGGGLLEAGCWSHVHDAEVLVPGMWGKFSRCTLPQRVGKRPGAVSGTNG